MHGTLCPICHRPNHCAVAEGKEVSDCWCSHQYIPTALLLRFKDTHSCICKECVDAYCKEHLSNTVHPASPIGDKPSSHPNGEDILDTHPPLDQEKI